MAVVTFAAVVPPILQLYVCFDQGMRNLCLGSATRRVSTLQERLQRPRLLRQRQVRLQLGF